MCVVKVPFRTCSGLERKPNRISNSLTDYRNFGSFLRTPLVHFVQMTQSSYNATQISYNATQISYNLTSHNIRIRSYLTYIISMAVPNAIMLDARRTYPSVGRPSAKRACLRQLISIKDMVAEEVHDFNQKDHLSYFRTHKETEDVNKNINIFLPIGSCMPRVFAESC